MLALTGCDVHEFPEENQTKVPFYLHLDFSTEMPLHKEITYSRGGKTGSEHATKKHDIRYIIHAYCTDNIKNISRTADATFIFSKSDIGDLNYTARLDLPEGNYEFKVWADYVDSNNTADKYYDTRDFSEIILANKKNHAGSNYFRDAFRGYSTATVKDPAYYSGPIINTIENQCIVTMQRPMGMFKFVTTDVDEFINILHKTAYDINSSDNPNSDSRAAFEQLMHDIDNGEYYVVFRYNAFMPCSYNIFTDKPADSWTGITFKSQLFTENEQDIVLGYDYVFVNGTETTLSISLEVYNSEGQLLSSTNPINVPIARSKLTLVKGEFLTSEASGGVTINPGYDGDDYNIEI